MAFCIQCGTDLLVDEARFCPLCGTPQPDLSKLAAAPPAAQAPPAVQPPPAAEPPQPPAAAAAQDNDDDVFARAGSPLAAPENRATPGATPGPPRAAKAPRAPRQRASGAGLASSANEAYFSRLGKGDLLTAGGSLVVLVSLFVTWFSGTVHTAVPGKDVNVADSLHTDAMGAGGWHWLIFLLGVALIIYVAVRTLPGEGVILPVPHWQLLAVATGTNLVLVVLSLLLPPDIGSWSPSYGALIGLVGAIAAFAGAVLRGREPEVITSAGAGTAAMQRARKPAAGPAPRRGRRPAVARVASATELAPTDVDVAPRSADATSIVRTPPPTARPAPADEGPPTVERRAPASQAAGAGVDAGPARSERPTANADEVVCGICSTVNSATARVCRTCGVMIAAGRRG